MAPDLLMIEAADTLWKKTRRRELSAAEQDRALGVLVESGVVVCPAQALLPRALALVQQLAQPVCDGVDLALAERERTTPFGTPVSRPGDFR